MEDNTQLIEKLIERIADYGLTTYELVKLKTISKALDLVSSFVPQSIVFILFFVCLLLLNLGLALWLGELLGKIYFGFFAVAAAYGLFSLVVHLFFKSWLKKEVSNYLIKLLIN